MVRINEEGYLEKTHRVGVGKATRSAKRFWWSPKWNSNHSLSVEIGKVYVPKRYEGKKLCFKVEVVY